MIVKLLHKLDAQARRPGLTLNKERCEFLACICKPTPKFTDGALIKHAKKAKHLGALLTDNSCPDADLANRLAKGAWNIWPLKDMWDHPHALVAWKLQVFESTVSTAVLYGLDASNLAERRWAKLNYFNRRCLRRILSTPAACIFSDNALAQGRCSPAQRQIR